MANWYVSSVAYTAVAQFAISHAYNIGDIVRQLAAPTVGNERCFRCTTAGTSAGSEPAWTLTKGSTTTSGGATFTEVSGNETWQGTSWSAPMARVWPFTNTAGTPWTANGDTIYVSSDHAETQSSAISFTCAQTLRILCATRPSSAIPPVAADAATTATISTTGASSITLIDSTSNGGGQIYWYGISFSAGNSSNSASIGFNNYQGAQDSVFENCAFIINNTALTSRINLGITGAQFPGGIIWKNCNLTFGHINQGFKSLSMSGFIWEGGSLLGTGPTNLFGDYTANNAATPAFIRDVDLSVMGSSTFLVNQPTNVGRTGITFYDFSNCKISASLGGVNTGGSPDFHLHGDIDFVASDSTTNVAREEHYRVAGSVVADTANYVTAGATDGVTHKSWKFVTNSSATRGNDLVGPDIFYWVSATGSKTITMVLANIAGTSFKDIDVGFDVSYLGSASTPLGTAATSFPVPHSSGTTLTTDTSAWTGQGGLTKQKVTKTVTFNMIGWVRIRPRVAKASVTVWIDPLITVA